MVGSVPGAENQQDDSPGRRSCRCRDREGRGLSARAFGVAAPGVTRGGRARAGGTGSGQSAEACVPRGGQSGLLSQRGQWKDFNLKSGLASFSFYSPSLGSRGRGLEGIGDA